MTDIEMTELCLAAMGWKHLGAVGIEPPKRGEPDQRGLWCLSGGNDWWLNPEGHSVCAPCSGLPNPLHDDAQAMALVKRFGLRMIRTSGDLVEWSVSHGGPGPFGFGALNADLNRSICECVAKMQAATAPPQ